MHAMHNYVVTVITIAWSVCGSVFGHLLVMFMSPAKTVELTDMP